MHAVLRTAQRLKSPVILETSPGETAFMGIKELVALVKTCRKEYGIPIFLNLDHATKEKDVMAALKAGFDLLHFDGGEYEYEANITVARRIVVAAHKRGRIVEAEMDHITGSSGIHRGSTKKELSKGVFTDPDRAGIFVRATHCDTFASFIGNLHGLYTSKKKLDFDRLKDIRKKTGSCFLSLHGGSGISDDQIKKAIKFGITKININTETRLAFSTALRKALTDNASEITPYKYFGQAIEEVRLVTEKNIKLFGTEGKA